MWDKNTRAEVEEEQDSGNSRIKGKFGLFTGKIIYTGIYRRIWMNKGGLMNRVQRTGSRGDRKVSLGLSAQRG